VTCIVAGLSEHVERNRESWSKEAPSFVEDGRHKWQPETPPGWGVWDIPEADLKTLPPLEGIDAIELGCGTGYWSAWLARGGARPVGVDITPEQLATARDLQAVHGVDFPLIEANAEEVPLPDASFDLALSEYGASIWCDPYRWIPEAARLLRPGGRLVFLVNSVLLMLCTDTVGKTSEALVRPLFGMFRFEWDDDDDSMEFHLPHGKLIALLRENGFAIEALHELQAPADAALTRYEAQIPKDWSTRWPSEEIWVVRKEA
jgi:ubiquinone/menaquinone biosynthesis C-methylase UbiE